MAWIKQKIITMRKSLIGEEVRYVVDSIIFHLLDSSINFKMCISISLQSYALVPKIGLTSPLLALY